MYVRKAFLDYEERIVRTIQGLPEVDLEGCCKRFCLIACYVSVLCGSQPEHAGPTESTTDDLFATAIPSVVPIRGRNCKINVKSARI
jgi:hypothetical protein